jgi:hypothetical protein
MHRIKKSVSGDLTMIRPLIPLSPNVLSAWIACKIIRVSASSCSTLADCDTDKSIDAASKLVYLLYDQKGKLKEDYEGWTNL